MNKRWHSVSDCSAAGIACVVISGVTKNGSYVVGERRLRQKQERLAQWNAVLVNGEWRLLDVLWASCALVGRRVAGWRLVDVLGETDAKENADGGIRGEPHYHNNEFFFITDPDLFVCTHLPDDPAWQLLPQPLSSRQFEQFVYLRERFFEMGLLIKADSQRYCVLETTNGEVTISFGIPTTVSDKPEFKYMLYKKGVGCAQGDEQDKVGDDSDENDKADGDDGAVADNDDNKWKCVVNQQTTEEISYECHMPMKGNYIIDIFGRANTNADCMDLVCSYVIVCHSTGDRLPDAAGIGWGPGDELEEVGLRPNNHPGSKIDTNARVVTIQLYKSPDADNVFWHAIKHEKFDEGVLRPHATLRISDNNDGVIVVLRLLESGTYAYTLFADFRTEAATDGIKATTAADIPNVCNYLIHFSDKRSRPEPQFPLQLRWGILGYGIHAQAFRFKMTGPGANGYIETPLTKIVLEFSSLCHLVYEFSTRLVKLNVLDRDVNDPTSIVDVTLPGGGEYALNIYARRSVDECRLYHVHSMHIVSSAPRVVEDDPVAADCPIDVGLTTGQSMLLESAADELQPTTNQLAPPQQNADTMSIAESVHIGDDDDKDELPDGEATGLKKAKGDDIGSLDETTEEMYRVKLAQSERPILFAAERKAAQHSPSYIKMARNRDVLNVRLPQVGDYIIEVFEFVDKDNNLVGNAQRTHVRRLTSKEMVSRC